MVQTSFEEFKKFFKRIPPDRLDKVWFIKLIANSKIPISGSWIAKNNHLNYYQVKDAMNNGNNIAVVALPYGVLFVDLDCEKDDKGKKIYGKLIAPGLLPVFEATNTFTIKTTTGGYHFVFLNNGFWATQNMIVNGKDAGELRANHSYVTCVGSWVDGKYEVVNDAEIKPFEGEITKLFKKSDNAYNIRDAPLHLHGKKGIPMSMDQKKKIKSGVSGTEERRKEILAMLRKDKNVI
jgi:hypothetical protein